MDKIDLSAIILTKNENTLLKACLKTLSWCKEIIIINHGDNEDTEKIAEHFAAKLINFKHSSFARLREEGLKRATSKFIFYIDPDERVTPQLAREIIFTLKQLPNKALALRRTNICYGYCFNYGGWEKDIVTRIFPRKALKGWTGLIHESPVHQLETINLKQTLIHLTHRSTKLNLAKSADWTIKEAQLLYKSGIKAVNFFTLLRKGGMEFMRRAFLKKGYKDGLAGLIEALVQAMNRVFVYIQVWEMQQKPSLTERYSEVEQKIAQEWAKVKK